MTISIGYGCMYKLQYKWLNYIFIEIEYTIDWMYTFSKFFFERDSTVV